MTLVPRPTLLLAMACGAALLVPPGARLDAQADLRERTLFVSAVDGRGDPVEDLGVGDFVVREDGARREVLRASRATEPIDIALLVDNSSAAERAVVQIREGLRAFVSAMAGTDHQMALVALADRPTVFVDYTSDQASLNAGIDRIFAMQRSAMTLLDGLIEVTRALAKRPSSRAVVVPVVTDGTEFTTYYARDVADALARARVALHAVTLGTFPASFENAYRERARVLDVETWQSGGQRVLLVSATGIEPALSRLAAELSWQYKVVYARPQSLIPPEKVEVSSGRAGVTVRGVPMRGQEGT